MFELDPELIKLVYVVAGFVAVALSSLINWKTNDPPEPFNSGKFLSAYIRTAWGLVPLALSMASSLGLTVEGILAVSAIAFGIDNGVQAALSMGAKKPVTSVLAASEGVEVSVAEVDEA